MSALKIMLKQITLLSFIFIFLYLPGTLSFAAEKILSDWDINQNQPISIGEEIYDMGVVVPLNIGDAYFSDGHVYTYSGIEGKNLKVTHKATSRNALGKETVTTTELSLPINNNQTLLKTAGNKIIPPKELLIIIVDDFSRIRVIDSGEYVKQQQLKDHQEKINNNPLFVSGVMMGNNPLVIIGDDVYGLGDTVQGFTINKIDNNVVEFMDANGNIMRSIVGK